MGNKNYNPDRVNKNGVSVASDGSGYLDCSLAPVNSVPGTFIPPLAAADIISATGTTGVVPTMYPRTKFPDYDNFSNLGMKS